jgi:hypothetical protein
MPYQKFQQELQDFLGQAYKRALSEAVKRGIGNSKKKKKLYTRKVNKSKV